MVNILMDGNEIDADWLYEALKMYIKPHHSVTVIAFSFYDDEIRSAADWDSFYSKENGIYYDSLTSGFASYGIPENQITFLNYVTDTKESAARKIEAADIIYFPGGLPDRMMDRIKEFDLYPPLMKHNGIVMGFSAGAVIQLAEYHLSPDEDYPEFQYFNGLPYLNSFYLEVHDCGTDLQYAAIQRVLAERGKTVYATAQNAGAVLVDNGTVKLIGNVRAYNP